MLTKSAITQEIDSKQLIVKKLIDDIKEARKVLSKEISANNKIALSALETIEKNCNEILNTLHTEDTRVEKHHYFIDEITAIIKKNISDFDFDSKRLADIMNTSLVTLNRKIKKVTGSCTTIYIRQLKLERAKYLLENSELSIAEIQVSCGYDMGSYFCRVFKEEFGMSPLKYRKGVRKS